MRITKDSQTRRAGSVSDRSQKSAHTAVANGTGSPSLLLRCFFRPFNAGRQERLEDWPLGAVIEANDPFFPTGGYKGSIRADRDGVEEIRAARKIADVSAVIGIHHAD